MLELEFEEKKREALPRETPRPLLPAVGWFWALLCSMESRDCCLSKILGMDSLPFFLMDVDEDEEDFSEEDETTFLLGYGAMTNVRTTEPKPLDLEGEKIMSVGEIETEAEKGDEERTNGLSG